MIIKMYLYVNTCKTAILTIRKSALSLLDVFVFPATLKLNANAASHL